jgi:RNA polymerase sigma-70 factor, ECF subfamily
MDEKILIDKAKDGDKKALAEIVKNYEKTVYNFSFKICRDPDRAENIMQETFLSIIKSLHQFDGNSKLSTWIYRIAANHCLMAARKQRNKHFVSLDNEDSLYNEGEFADWSNAPYKSTEREELKDILDKAIQKLSPDYRIVFLLRDVEGLSTEETAKVTQLSVPAVKSRLHRARAFLRKEINEAMQYEK